MAPRDIEQQTYAVIYCLFNPSRKSSEFRTQDIEPDCPDDDDDSFDPVIIADQLREIADELDERVISQFRGALESASKKQVQQAFEKTVDTLCNTWILASGEVAMERCMLKASVTLGLYVQRNCPNMVSTIEDVMAHFLNTRVAQWVSRQGGWDRVAAE